MTDRYDLRTVADGASDAWDTAPKSHQPILRDCSDALIQAADELDRLPKTADGVPIVPGDSVYMQWTGHERRVRAVHSDSIAVTVGCIAATLVNVHPNQCYSTKEAAEKARTA